MRDMKLRDMKMRHHVAGVENAKMLQYIQLHRLCYPRQRLWHNVRPTSQRRAVSPAALFSATPDCRWRRRLSRFFARRHIFHQHFRSLIYNDDDRALHDISADFTMTSPLLCGTAYVYVSWMESLCDLFLPVVQSQAVEEHDSLDNTPFQLQLFSLFRIVAVCVFCLGYFDILCCWCNFVALCFFCDYSTVMLLSACVVRKILHYLRYMSLILLLTHSFHEFASPVKIAQSVNWWREIIFRTQSLPSSWTGHRHSPFHKMDNETVQFTKWAVSQIGR